MAIDEISIEVEGEIPSTSYPKVSGLPAEYKRILKEDGEMEALVLFEQKPDGEICISQINGELVNYEKQKESMSYMDDFYSEMES